MKPDCGAIAPAGGAAGFKTAGSGVRSCKVRHGPAPTINEQGVELANRAAARRRALGALVRYECKKHSISAAETEEFAAWAMAGTSPQERAGHTIKLIKFEKVMDHVRHRLATEPGLLLKFYSTKDLEVQAANIARANEARLLAEQRAADERHDREYERALMRDSWDEEDEDLVSTTTASELVFGDVDERLAQSHVLSTDGMLDWEPPPLHDLFARVPGAASPTPPTPPVKEALPFEEKGVVLPAHAVFPQRNARGNRPGKQQRAIRRVISSGLATGAVIELPARKTRASMMHAPIAQIIRHSALARECVATYEEPPARPPAPPPNTPVVLFPVVSGKRVVGVESLPESHAVTRNFRIGQVVVPVPMPGTPNVRCVSTEPRDCDDLSRSALLPPHPVTPPSRRPPSLPECVQHVGSLPIVQSPVTGGYFPMLYKLRLMFLNYVRGNWLAFRTGFNVGWNRRLLPRVACKAAEARDIDPPDTLPREPNTSLSYHLRRWLGHINPFVSYNTWLVHRSAEIAMPTPREGIRAISVQGIAPPRTDEVVKTANALVSSIRPKFPGDTSAFEEAVSNLVRRCKIQHSAANDAIILALNSCLDSRERAQRRQEFANADHYRNYLWWMLPRAAVATSAAVTAVGAVACFRSPSPSI